MPLACCYSGCASAHCARGLWGIRNRPYFRRTGAYSNHKHRPQHTRQARAPTAGSQVSSHRMRLPLCALGATFCDQAPSLRGRCWCSPHRRSSRRACVAALLRCVPHGEPVPHPLYEGRSCCHTTQVCAGHSRALLIHARLPIQACSGRLHIASLMLGCAPSPRTSLSSSMTRRTTARRVARLSRRPTRTAPTSYGSC